MLHQGLLESYLQILDISGLDRICVPVDDPTIQNSAVFLKAGAGYGNFAEEALAGALGEFICPITVCLSSRYPTPNMHFVD